MKALPCLQPFFSLVMLDLIILNRKGKYGLSPKSTQIRQKYPLKIYHVVMVIEDIK